MSQGLPDERGQELSHSWLPMSEQDGSSDHGSRESSGVDGDRAGEAPASVEM